MIMENPSIVGLPDTISYVNDNGKLLFAPGFYVKTFYMIDYGEPISVIKDTDIDDFLISSSKLSEFVEGSMLEYATQFVDYFKTVILIPWNTYYILYDSSGDISIIDNDKVVVELEDKETSFQKGDGESIVEELSNGDLLIRNGGDVSSCVLITMRNVQVYKCKYDVGCEGEEGCKCDDCADIDNKLSISMIDELNLKFDKVDFVNNIVNMDHCLL